MIDETPTSAEPNSDPTHHDAAEASRDPMRSGVYTLWAISTCVLFVAATLALNYVVDPYLRFERIRADGINAYRPMSLGQVRMAKAYQVRRVKPKTIILGNSRVDLGINPRSTWWDDDSMPVYNAGQPGGGMWANLLYLQHAGHEHDIEQVVLGLDFFDFYRNQSKTSTINDKSRDIRRFATRPSGAINTDRWKALVADTVYSMLSVSAMCDSAVTIASQSDSSVADIDAWGMTSGRPFRRVIARQGQRSLVDEKNAEYRRKLTVKHGGIFQPKQTGGSAPDSVQWRYLDEIIRFCNDREIKLTVFLHPYHVELLGLINDTDCWPSFDQWKRELVRRCGKSIDPIDVWDFACVSPVTTEPVPDSGDRTSIMNWYWESGHYRHETGDLMLATMFGDQTDSNDARRQIAGRALNRIDIESHLAEQRHLLNQMPERSPLADSNSKARLKDPKVMQRPVVER